MKYIFIILICFLGLTSTAQVQKQPRSNFPTVVDSSLAIGKNFILPVFRSFSQLATYNVLDSSGRLVFIRDSNAVFFRDNAHTWVKLAYFDAGSDAWQLTGNTISSGQFLGTINNLALALKAYNKNVASFNGNTMIVSLGDIDSLNNGTSLIINDQQGNDGLTKGRYEFNRRNFKIGQIDYIFPPAQGAPGSYLYNPGNGFLTWNIPGSSGTFPGIDSFTISPPPPSLTTSVGYWIDGAPIFYPLAGDSSKVINDTLFQYFGGDSIPYPVYGNQIFFGDTATISGDIFCSIKNGNDSCILINNNGRFVDSIGLDSDSTEYLYFNNDVQLGSFPTLQKILAPEPGQRATLRASNDSVYVGFNETGLPQSNSYLVSTGGVVLVDSTLTVTAPILWVYRGADSSEISNQVFTINTAATGDLRTDILWIDSLGVFTKTAGTPDSVTAVAPMIDYNGIIVAYADIDGSTITVNGVSSFQGNGVVYTQGTGVNNGQAKTDSVNFNYNETTRNLTLAGTFVSNKVGGVALSIDGGSAIRADRGSRIVYVDGDSSVTLRSGGYNHKAQLTAQGEFLIGSSGQVRIPSARLAVIDSTKGFLPPVMRGVRMNAISSPATGLIVYNSDSASLCLYNGSAWVKLGTGGGSSGTLQQAFDAAPTANPTINAHFNPFNIDSVGQNSRVRSDYPIGSGKYGEYGFGGGVPYMTYNYFGGAATATMLPKGFYSYGSDSLGNSYEHYAGTLELVQSIITSQKSSEFRFDSSKLYLNSTYNDSSPSDYKLGINTTTPDSTLHVVGGVAMPNLYESSDVTDSMVVKNADGGLGIRAIPGGGSGITPLYFDHIGSGQSNMAGRDATIGDWVYTKNDRTKSFNSSNLFVTADPALNNICYSDGAVTAERNNTAWQFSLNYAKDNLTDTVRLICEAMGSMGSWEWTPETTGDGEQTTSNTRLTALITKLDAAPSDYKAKLITMQYGENDAVTGNLIHFLNNVVKFYDTLRRHPKCDTNIVMQLVYPITNQPINGDSLRRCLDSIYYRTKDIGNRFITAVPHTYPGTASGHPSNDTTDLIGRLCYSNYLQGFGNGPIKPDSSYWKRSISPEFVYTPEKVVIGATSPISSSYIQNVIVNGTSTLAYFGRSNSGSNGNQQALTIITNSAGNTGSILMHRSEKSGSVVDRNGFGFRDTAIVALDSNQSSLGFFIGNNGVQISKPVLMSSNALATGNFLLTTSTQPLRIFNTTTTGVQMIVSNNSTTAATYSSIRFRSGSAGTYDLADLRTIVNAAGDGGHHAIFTRKSSGLAETIRFTDSNRVGIGTTTPTVRLSVVGDGTNAAAFTSGNVGIGTASPAASAALDITSTTQGVLMPRMTATQGSAISSPADALLIYVTDTNGTFTSIGFWGRENGVWVKL